MGFEDILYDGRVLRPMKATVKPAFNEDTVLAADPWDFVDLWLRRHRKRDARSFWQQARDFANAAKRLPPTSAPLPAYYCFLNATKTLLTVADRQVGAFHGVHGTREKSRTSLAAELVNFQTGGTLAGLCQYLDEPPGPSRYCLKDVLYNLPYIHRAFLVTYRNFVDLFIPIRKPRFVRKSGSSEAWFCAEVETRYNNKRTARHLPSSWEFDAGDSERGTVRFKSRFTWDAERPSSEANQKRLTLYHKRVRRHLRYINGVARLWYIKKQPSRESSIERSSLTLAFAAMHRLSELSRYDPLAFRAHLDRKHNWLLAEFITSAPKQFVDEVASEITGRDLMVPGIRK